jgi:3-dehydroquinate synthase
MTPVRIDVASAQGTYPVFVGAGLLRESPDYLRGANLASPVVVTVPPVWRHHGAGLADLAGQAGPVMMPDGERAKTLRTVTRLYEAFLVRRAERTTPIVALGGGVAGDTAGFAAATFLRGLPLVHVPTTLLAQVDSAIGGKVGVNLAQGKNLAGAFYPPRLVLCDPEVLRTLPRREFRAGLYEVIKYGVIASPMLFDLVSANLKRVLARDADLLTQIVVSCCRVKADVVGRDEYERGSRRVLNFGHTIGHALETVTGYRRFRHGEAVACGMLAAAHVSASRGLMPREQAEALADLVRRLGALPSVDGLRPADVLEAMARDKKARDGRLAFVLSAGLGTTRIESDVTAGELTAALAAIGLRG